MSQPQSARPIPNGDDARYPGQPFCICGRGISVFRRIHFAATRCLDCVEHFEKALSAIERLLSMNPEEKAEIR